MQDDNVLIYIIKRCMPPQHPSSFDYAAPVNSNIKAQRLQCSGRTVKRMEIVFPIRVDLPPTGTVFDERGNVVQDLIFDLSVISPSKAIFFTDCDIKFDSKTM